MQNLSGGTLFKCYPGPFSSVSYTVFPLTVLPTLFPASSSSTLSRYSSCHFFPKHFPDLFPRLTFFFYSYPPGFSFRWFVFLSASFPAYPFSVLPAPPLFCNLAHLTLLAPSLAHSAIFPAILPVVFSCAASDPPLSFSRYSPSPPRAFPFHAGSMLHLFSSVCDFPSSVHPRFLSSKLPERFPEPLIPVIRGAIQTEI